VQEYSTSFVGREPEIALLRGMLDDADSGAGGVAVVSGEAGIGKSRLVSEAATSARDRGHRVLAGYFPAIESAALDGLQQLFNQASDDEIAALDSATVQDLGPLLPTRLRDGAGGAAMPDRSSLVRGAEQLLRNLAAKQPLFVIVEDIHWADPSTILLLDALARRLRNSPVNIVVTARNPGTETVGPHRTWLAELGRIPGAHLVHLAGLSTVALAKMFTPLFGRTVSKERVHEIAERTLGNPLYALELARSLDGGTTGIPVQLRDLLTLNLDVLPTDTKHVVTVCALAVTEIGHRLLETVSGLSGDQLDEALAPALAAHVLIPKTEPRRYQIRHPLLADAITEATPGQQASRIHAAFAQAIDADASLTFGLPAAEMAHHWMRSGDIERAFGASLGAAQAAAATNAHTASLAHVQRAIELAKRMPDLVSTPSSTLGDLYGQAAFTAELLGRNREAVELARAALAAPETSELQAGERHLLLAELLRRGYHPPEEAHRLVDRAEEFIPADATASIARLEVARCWHWDTEPETSVEHGRRAVALAETLGNPVLLSQALVQTGGAVLVSGNVDEGLDLALRGRAVAEQAGFRVGVLTSHLPISAMLAIAGRPSAGADDALAGLARTRDTGDDLLLREGIAGFAASGLFLSGRWDEALDVAVESGGDGRYSTTLHLAQARITAFLGRPDEVREALASVAEFAGASDPSHVAVTSWLALLEGNAKQCHRMAWRMFEGDGPLRADLNNELAFLAAAGAVAAGHRSAAQRALGRLRESPKGMVELTPWALSAHAEVASLLGDSAVEWREALHAWEATGGWHHMRVYSACRLAESSPGGDVAEILTVAIDVARELGSGVLEERVHAAALKNAVVLPAPGTDSARLTPRESEVLELLAAGHSNRAIGQALGISEKTSSVHVSNLMRKLGVASRTEAAVRAVRGR